MRKQILILLAFLCSYSFGKGQLLHSFQGNVYGFDNERVSALKIGEQVPELVFGNFLNSSCLDSIRLSDYRGKLLLLDFWNTSCLICISQFPKLQKLQDEFSDSLKIFTVGIESFGRKTVRSFVEKRKGTLGEINLPVIIEELSPKFDNVLFKLFPWQSMPHVVWIGSKGELVGTTNHLAITKENIRAILNKQITNLSIRKHLRRISHKDLFIMEFENKAIGSRKIGAKLADYIDTIEGGELLLKSDITSQWHYLVVNEPIFTFYINAYLNVFPELTESGDFMKRILVESSNLHPFYLGWDLLEKDNWTRDSLAKGNLFNYELSLPNTWSVDAVYSFMRKSLDSLFNVRSSIQSRMVDVWELNVFDTEKYLLTKSTGGKDEWKYSERMDTFFLKNRGIDEIVGVLNDRIKRVLVTNGVKDKLLVDVELKIPNHNSIQDWNIELEKNGLRLISKKVLTRMLVLKDLR